MKNIIECTWEEIRAIAEKDAIAVLPVASLEQHGQHLPVVTDTILVDSVLEGASKRLKDPGGFIRMPVLWLGASHHHRPLFAVSIDEETWFHMVYQMAASLSQSGFRRLFILNGHGGNSAPLRITLAKISRDLPDLMCAGMDYWNNAHEELGRIRTSPPGGAAHAGELETSLMLHLSKESVRNRQISPSIPRWPDVFARDLVRSGPISVGVSWDQISRHGALGDPTAANEDKGGRFYEALCHGVARALEAFASLDPGDVLPPEG